MLQSYTNGAPALGKAGLGITDLNVSTFYVDETGFTGEDLLAADQPIFVNATNNFSAEEAVKLLADTFGDVNVKELKYRQLSRRPRHQERIIELIKILSADAKRAGAWVAHKEFALVTFVVDWWMEPLAHNGGLNLYKDGANLATANMLFMCFEGFWTRSFRRNLLMHFQKMFRARTPERFRECRLFVEKEMAKANPSQADTLRYMWPSFELLGFGHVVNLPQKVIDVAFPGLISIGHWWRGQHAGPWEAVHDQSSNMAKQQWLWDALSSPDMVAAEFANPTGSSIFPMNVISTRFADSEQEKQLQICDILAGATAEYLRALADGKENPYCQKLLDAGILNLVIGSLWPSTDVTPDELGRRGWDGNLAIEHIAQNINLKKR